MHHGGSVLPESYGEGGKACSLPTIFCVEDFRKTVLLTLQEVMGLDEESIRG